MIFVAIIIVAHLLSLNWIPLVTTVPMLSWIIYTYRATPTGYTNLFNPNNITDETVLNGRVRDCLFKTIFHLIHFVGYLYMAVLTLTVA